MKTKTKNLGKSTEYHLPFDLSEIIEKKHWELLRITNSELVILFWEIGKELNQWFTKNKGQEYGDSVNRTISTKLVTSYGLYFTEKNLKKMGQFANQFSDFSNVLLIGPIVSWEHILLLLPVKDIAAKLFYIRLTIEQGLSVNGLRRKMSANVIEQPKADKASKHRGDVLRLRSGHAKTNTQKILQILQLGLEQQSQNNAVIKNAFKEPLLSSFRPLMEPSKVPVELVKNIKINGAEEELFETLSRHIEKYKYRHNRWLNGNLNKSFWEIGKRINQKSFLYKESIDRKLIIDNASVQLEKKYNKYFSKKQLYEMSEFAEQFSDSIIAARISYLISWEHILALLSLHDIEAKLFYARLTAEKGLSIGGLRKQIAKNAYEQASGAKELEQNMIALMQNPIIKTSIEKKGNATVSITSHYIKFGDDIDRSLAVPNIFENLYLPLLALVTTKPSSKNMVSHKTNKK